MITRWSVESHCRWIFVDQDLSSVSVRSLSPRIGLEEKRDAARIQNHAHFVIYCCLLPLVPDYIRNGNVKIAVIPSVRCAIETASNLLPLVDSDCRGGIEHCLPVFKRWIPEEQKVGLQTYFQCVYCAWGPVENLTFLCVQSKTMSNQARNAWISKVTRMNGAITPNTIILTVIACSSKGKGCRESQVLLCCCQEVDFLNVVRQVSPMNW